MALAKEPKPLRSGPIAPCGGGTPLACRRPSARRAAPNPATFALSGMVYAVWRTKDIRIGIAVHIMLNSLA
jgi:hypothetical protein